MNKATLDKLQEWSKAGHRTVQADTLLMLAAEYPEMVALSADLTPTARLVEFKDTYPDRFFDEHRVNRFQFAQQDSGHGGTHCSMEVDSNIYLWPNSFTHGHQACNDLVDGRRTVDEPDWFGNLAISWNWYPLDNQQLAVWLDPDNTGALSLDGREQQPVKIAHEPLPNTIDTLSDYEVACEISYSNHPLVPEELLLTYDVGFGPTSAQLTATGEAYAYTAAIPAQPPGTTVDYFLAAADTAGNVDTAGVYKTNEADRDVNIIFPSPLPENVMEKLKEAQIKKELGIPVEQVLRELGYQ